MVATLRLLALSLLIAAIVRSYAEVPPGWVSSISTTKKVPIDETVCGRSAREVADAQKRQLVLEAALENDFQEGSVLELIGIGQVFLDECNYESATAVFQRVLDLDQKHFAGKGWQVSRDLNNLAIVQYLRSKCASSVDEQKRLLLVARDLAKRAQDCDCSYTGKIVAFNQIPILRDNGERSASETLRAQKVFDLP